MKLLAYKMSLDKAFYITQIGISIPNHLDSLYHINYLCVLYSQNYRLLK